MRPLILSKFIMLSCMLAWVTPQLVDANGAAWNLGEHTATPGPIKQTDLILEKEHVIFKEKKVTADFWVFNPTSLSLTVNMGFPIFDRGVNMATDVKAKDHAIKDYDNRHFGTTIIKVNGKVVDKAILSQHSGPYNIVWQWTMNFAPMSITIFSVEYPIDAHWESMGQNNSFNFTYITHTGSYWAKPIKEATFEYYSPRLVNLILHYPTGTYWSDFQGKYETQISLNWNVIPQPYEIDRERGRIVWHRANWLPQKDIDDIKIDIAVKYGDDDLPVFEEYCGEDNNQIFHDEHFGKRMKISNMELDKNSIAKLEFEAYYYDREKGQQYDNLPDHLKLKHRLNVLRYLRNYIYATHGHVFKDRDLKKCYGKVEQRINWSQIEKNNISFIENIEKVLTPEYENEMKKVKSKSINESVYSLIEDF